MVLYKCLGLYEPSIFLIRVNNLTITNENRFELDRMNAKQRSVYFHEYMHFLQDISTVYGLSNIYNNCRYLSMALATVTTKSNTILPLKHFSTNINNIIWLKNMTLGDGNCTPFSKFKITKINCGIEYPDQPNWSPPTVRSITIQGKSKEKEEEEIITFGAICIMESMAYLLEQILYPNDYEKSPDMPYSMAQKVAEKIYPTIASNKKSVFALCDMSLLTSNPGPSFVSLLKEMKNCEITDPHKMYDRIYMNHQADIKKAYDGSNSILTQVKEKLKSFFPATKKNNVYSLLDQQIEHIFYKIKKLRLKCPSFMYDAINRDEKTFIQFYNTIGTPLLELDKDMYFTEAKNVKIPIENFMILKQAFNLFYCGTKECCMKGLCKRSPKVIVDGRCENSPWTRCSESQLCPFAFWWKTFVANKYTPRF